MAELHLVKLCVGVSAVSELAAFIEQRSRGGVEPVSHVTRMRPTRADALMAGGSLYWVIGGAVRCRQEVLAIEPAPGEDGVARTALILRPKLIETESWPRRPFQGWRYLKPDEAPPDLRSGSGEIVDDNAPPPDMLAALAEVGVA